METPQVEKPKELAVEVTLSTQILQKHTLVFNTWIGQEQSEGEFNRLTDKLRRVSERQEIFYKRREILLAIEQDKETLENMKEDFPTIEARSQAVWTQSGKKGPWKLSQQELQQKEASKINMQRYKDRIAKNEALLAEYEELLNAPDRAADMQSG